MGLLDNVERGIENAVRGAFSRGSKSALQPVEIASRLRRDMDDKAMTLAAGRTLVPNVFDVQLSAADFERARSWGTALAEELCDIAIRHARSQSYVLQGPVRVTFNLDDSLKAGDFRIDASTEKSGDPRGGQQSAAQNQPNYSNHAVPAPPVPRATPPSPRYPANVPAAPRQAPGRLQPVLDLNGQRYSLNASSIILGRSSEADILVDDTGVSRRHLEIRTENGQSIAVDLGSTNGSYVNGHKVSGSAELADGSTITMGRSKLVFRMLPARSSAPSGNGGNNGNPSGGRA